MAKIDQLFVYMNDRGGSDLHLVTGMEPRIRLSGELEVVEGWPVLSEAQISGLLREITPEAQWQAFEETWDLDMAYGVEGLARFRANYFRREGGRGAVFRIIPTDIKTLEELGAPEALSKLVHIPRGLVLVTGPTGSGKSTTLAAVINAINETYCRHIVTIEDPVEFVHTNKKSVFCHREVGDDTESFAGALRAAIRQDADVIVVGEMRGLETVSLAMTAAEMGMLVFGTLHTNSAIKTIDRLIDVFPAEQQEQARLTLSECLAGVVAQLLLPAADGKGRVAVHEILLRAGGLANIIRQGNTPQLYSVLQSGKSQGMQSMDDALWGALEADTISPMIAYLKAREKKRFVNALPPESRPTL